MLLALIIVSFSKVAFLKSRVIPPKIASKLAPLKLSLSLFNFCSENVAIIFSKLFLLISFILSSILSFTLSPNKKEIPIAIKIKGILLCKNIKF